MLAPKFNAEMFQQKTSQEYNIIRYNKHNVNIDIALQGQINQ